MIKHKDSFICPGNKKKSQQFCLYDSIKVVLKELHTLALAIID